ncbi:putative patellin [Helianthus annuus]|nr:putative patellin [Helianthus annuus]
MHKDRVNIYENHHYYANDFRFLRWWIQFLKRSIRKLDFSPNEVCTIVQVIDFKNSHGPFKWELRQATNQAWIHVKNVSGRILLNDFDHILVFSWLHTSAIKSLEWSTSVFIIVL